jgi:hypothetical protein
MEHESFDLQLLAAGGTSETTQQHQKGEAMTTVPPDRKSLPWIVLVREDNCLNPGTI